MSQKQSKLYRRITWRVIGITMFFNVFIIGALVVVSLGVSLVESDTRACYVMDGIQGKLATMHSAVEIAATNNVAEIESHLGNPTELSNALEHELRLNRNYLGCAVALEPHFFPSQGRWFETYVQFTDSTHVECRQIGSAQHDYFQQDWYTKGLELEHGQGVMTDPYFDADGVKGMVSTYVTPIHDCQGQKVGVYGIDLNLNWLETAILQEEERVKEIEMSENEGEEENSFFVQLIDSQGHKIAGSETFDEATLQKILQKDSVALERIELNGTVYYVWARQVRGTKWTLIVAMHWEVVYFNGVVLCSAILFLIVIGAIVIFFFTSRSIRRAIKPLRFLSNSAQAVAQGHFNTPLPVFKHNDEISQLRDAFDTMQQSLTRYVEELKTSTAAKASIESELNVAQSIQMSMLPKTFPAFPERDDIELFGSLTPAKAVGGDLYDFFIRDEQLFFCIGDVSGKGVPASLVMAVTRTLFRNVAMHVAEPAHIVEAMNHAISEGNDNNMFVTLFIGVLDLGTGHLRYCNAGHDAPIIIHDKCQMTNDELPAPDSSFDIRHSSFLPCQPNLPIGVMPDWTFQEQEADIALGLTLFLYTDGLTEAENATHELFGMERIFSVVHTHAGTSTEELIGAVADAVHLFVGETEQSDDLTLLAIKYTGSTPPIHQEKIP